MTKIKLTTIKVTQKKYLSILSKNQEIQLEFHHAKFFKVILNFTLNSRQLPITGQIENTCTMIRRSPSLLTLALILVKENYDFFFHHNWLWGRSVLLLRVPFFFLRNCVIHMCHTHLSSRKSCNSQYSTKTNIKSPAE